VEEVEGAASTLEQTLPAAAACAGPPLLPRLHVTRGARLNFHKTKRVAFPADQVNLSAERGERKFRATMV
jgi:hypothetical protein